MVIYHYRIHGIQHTFIRSYHISMIQQLKINQNKYKCLQDYHSNSLPDKSGVPQISVLSPHLFIIYVSDIAKLK